jgi:hypothetical protein
MVDFGAQPASPEGYPLAARASTSTIKTEPESDIELTGPAAIKKEPESDVKVISHPQPTVLSDSDSDVFSGPMQLASTSMLVANYDSNSGSDTGHIHIRHASTFVEVKAEPGTTPAPCIYNS